MRPVCVGCCTEMNCRENGVFVKANRNHFYSGDLYHCKSCGREVIIGFGNSMYIEKESKVHTKVDLHKRQLPLIVRSKDEGYIP